MRKSPGGSLRRGRRYSGRLWVRRAVQLCRPLGRGGNTANPEVLWGATSYVRFANAIPTALRAEPLSKGAFFICGRGVTPSFDRASDHPSALPDSPAIPCIISRFASELTIWVHGCPAHSSDRLFLSDHNKLRPLSVYSRPLSDSPANAVIKFLASLHQHLRLFLTRQYRVL